MSIKSSDYRRIKKKLTLNYISFTVNIYNKSQIDDLYIFGQDLILFWTRMLCCLCYIQVFYFHFYHNTLVLDLESDLPPLMKFHLVIWPRRFQIAHQRQTRNPHYRRQHPARSVNMKCLQISRFVFSGCHFWWWRKPESTEKTNDLSQVTDKLYHIIILIWLT